MDAQPNLLFTQELIPKCDFLTKLPFFLSNSLTAVKPREKKKNLEDWLLATSFFILYIFCLQAQYLPQLLNSNISPAPDVKKQVKHKYHLPNI